MKIKTIIAIAALSCSSLFADFESDDPLESGSVTSETTAQENAVRMAEEYLESSAFSRKGLIEQLIFEGFSRAEAIYAVDQVY